MQTAYDAGPSPISCHASSYARQFDVEDEFFVGQRIIPINDNRVISNPGDDAIDLATVDDSAGDPFVKL